jgi:WD40 repeat protein
MRQMQTRLRKAAAVFGMLAAVVLCNIAALVAAADGEADDAERVKRPLWRYDGPGGDCSFSPNGTRVVATGEKYAIVLDAATGKPLTPRLEHGNLVYTSAFSPDGKRVVTASADNTARIWDAASGKELARLAHPEWLNTAAFSPDGTKVVTASGDRTARVWDATAGKPLLSLAHNDAVVTAAFSPDGAKVLTVGRFPDAAAYLWDAATGKRLVGPLRLESASCATFSRDGTKIAVGDEAGSDRVASVWDASNGKLIATTGKHWGRVNAVAFSPDAAKVATSTDGYVRIWDAATGKPLTKPLGDRVSMMHEVAFSPDGRQLLATGEGSQTALWDAAAGKVIARLNAHDAETSAAFSPDGRRVVTAGSNATSVVDDQQHATSVWRVGGE